MSLIERKDTREWILTGDPARVDHGPPVFPGTGVRVVPKTEWAVAARQLRGAVDETRREIYRFLNSAGHHVAAAKVAAQYGIDTDHYAHG
jgi:hypothetical protein